MGNLKRIHFESDSILDENQMKKVIGGRKPSWCCIDGECIAFTSCTDKGCQDIYGPAAECEQ